MYGKIFDSIYDGTLRAHWQGLVTFQQIIILADKDGVIDMTPHAIHGRTGIPLEIIESGLDHLSKPDPYSRSSAEEGRRIVLLDDHRPWGWRLVNHDYYNKLRSAEEKRVADRDRISEKRKSIKSDLSRDVAGCSGQSHGVADVAPIAVDVSISISTDIKTSRFMFDLIKTLNPKHREPSLTSWANDVRLMREQDGRADADIRSLFEWANQHHFWKTNILSPATLRKQWDKLVIQRDNTGADHAARQPIDNSAVGKVRRANEERERRAADAERQAGGPSVAANGGNVRPPLDQ